MFAYTTALAVHFRQRMTTVLFCLLLAALGKGSWDLVWRIAYEWYRPYGGDAMLFAAMGRAIVNGLTPYVDLFENKPPGIFLLAALSLRFFNTLILGRVLQIIAIFLVPLVAVFADIGSYKHAIRKSDQWMDRLIVLLFGIVLATLTSRWAGSFYPESFGILFSLFYIAWFVTARTDGWAALLLGGVFIAGAAGFKEVFLFSLLAIALVLSKTRREFFMRFCLPLGIATAAGAFVLLILGYLVPYITVYVPYLLRWHDDIVILLNPEADPLWLRGFPLQSFWKNAASVSVVFPLLLVFLWSVILVQASSLWKTRKAILAPCVLLGATYSAVLAGQMAGGKSHHFAVLLPFFLAILLRAMLTGAWSRIMWIRWGVILSLGAIVLPQRMAFSMNDFAEESRNLLIAEHIAEQVDFVLDNCNVDRYLRLIVSDIPELLFVRHSPLPTGLMSTRDYNNMAVTPLNRMLSQSLLDAKIALVIKGFGAHTDVHNYLQEHFTKSPPWPCAGPFDLPEEWILLFRKA